MNPQHRLTDRECGIVREAYDRVGNSISSKVVDLARDLGFFDIVVDCLHRTRPRASVCVEAYGEDTTTKLYTYVVMAVMLITFLYWFVASLVVEEKPVTERAVWFVQGLGGFSVFTILYIVRDVFLSCTERLESTEFAQYPPSDFAIGYVVIMFSFAIILNECFKVNARVPEESIKEPLLSLKPEEEDNYL